MKSRSLRLLPLFLLQLLLLCFLLEIDDNFVVGGTAHKRLTRHVLLRGLREEPLIGFDITSIVLACRREFLREEGLEIMVGAHHELRLLPLVVSPLSLIALLMLLEEHAIDVAVADEHVVDVILLQRALIEEPVFIFWFIELINKVLVVLVELGGQS